MYSDVIVDEANESIFLYNIMLIREKIHRFFD